MGGFFWLSRVVWVWVLAGAGERERRGKVERKKRGKGERNKFRVFWVLKPEFIVFSIF